MAAAGEIARTGLEIAVIGMSGRFPGARDLETYWSNLKNGIESITFFSDEELAEAGIPGNLLGNRYYVKAKGMMAEVECFDASFFGYLPGEALVMDPQLRLFHEYAWKALEDAGYVPGGSQGVVGLYAGASPHLTWELLTLVSDLEESVDEFSATRLRDKDYLSTRVSYKLNLKGPSVTLQTACSTSLVAIDGACRALLTGICDMALAGGVKVFTSRKSGYLYQEGMVSSPDGHCRAFDARAGGLISGEGVGVVVLKRLEDALADRDYIYCIIRGFAINNDGMEKAGFSAPSIEGQAETLRAALQMAEVEPEQIGYIETHGTATPIGDPVEIEALKLAFNSDKRNYCAIGSVKTNIGHLDTAAGAAGIIKAALALKYRQIPPSLHFESPNPKVDFQNSPFYVNPVLKEWTRQAQPLMAGVSSFGIGGTNAHIILEEAPERETLPSTREKHLLLLSAKTPPALERASQNLAGFLQNNPGLNLADVAYTLQVGRKPMELRRLAVCSTPGEAAALLADPDPENRRTFKTAGENRPVVFMFSGLGSQYVGMGRDLYREEPLFREEMDRCFDRVSALTGQRLNDVLYPAEPGDTGKEIPDFEQAQLVVFIFEYALAKLLLSWGISPQAMIGYSFGEYSAACLAEVLSLEDTLSLIVARGKLIKTLPPGSMASVPLPLSELEPILAGNPHLAAAVDNGLSCIVAGPPPDIAAAK